MPADVPSVTAITLRWLLRLRWVGLVGQMAALAFAATVIRLDLPWVPLFSVLGVAVATNIVLQRRSLGNAGKHQWVIAAVIGVDVILLTVIIFFTGGASNPFTSFYLVLVALGAMTLNEGWLTGVVALAVIGYLVVFYNGVPLRGPDGIGEIGCPGFGLHLQGMAVAFFLTSTCIAYFVRKMHGSLQQRDVALTEMSQKAARVDQFSALAALAAGVAHELGSPLGTIAVASRELEVNLEKQAPSPGTLEDARLIRMEVERCRSILDRLDRRSTAGTGDAPEPCDAHMIVDDLKQTLPAVLIARLVVRDLTRGIQFHLPRSPLVQALIVLVQNASEADDSQEDIELNFTLADNRLNIAVLDRGHGMTDIVRKHAGEPFFTTKPPRKGMGLGLFLVRTLAQQLGGELRHEPREGGGTRAELQLSAVPA
jgi:two-component system sensor histidine kinase RegB